ncbi:hypothetical protein BsIDN1_42490 [Bacillus safensis]|uniref:OB-fold nucleic acid binding domain-containing protein n=1 Tax=Bacillus safensis TaxID=561879 RepID=A0A5S9MCK4_BACIA|nr:hypothetical protein BsIDN1_42490 [Bacillus safensis]
MKIHSRGHVYFTLKDEKRTHASRHVPAFRSKAAFFHQKSGMKVFVRGGIQVYEPSGNYQLYAKKKCSLMVLVLFISLMKS